MRRHATLWLVVAVVVLAVAVMTALQWHARYQFQTRGWADDFPAPVPDTPGAGETGVPRLCVNAPLMAYDDDALLWAVDTIASGGFAWVRLRIAWSDVEPEPDRWAWEDADRAVAAARERGMRVWMVLDGAPDWAGLPPDPAAFARFAGAAADRYGSEVSYYQIWHNPNLGESWGGHADAFAYTDLLSRSAEVIRAADADARIVLGSLAPTVERGQRNYAETLFLEMLDAAGAGPYFDVVAAQPYGFDHSPLDRRVQPDLLNFSRVVLIRETLERLGYGDRALWASHVGWNSKPPDWPGPASIWGEVDAATQAAYTAAALDRVDREWPWMGVACINSFQPRVAEPVSSRSSNSGAGGVPDAEEHWGFAMVGPDREPRPLYDALAGWAASPVVAHTGVYRADTSLADFEGPWTLGPQGADIGEHGESRVRLTFEGTGLALTVRRGPYRAFLFVEVDGMPAPALPRDREGRAYVVLYDPLAAESTVPLAEDLEPGPHTVEIVAERGWGQWALADWRVVNAPPGRRAYAWTLAGLGLVGLGALFVVMWAGRHAPWPALASRLAAFWHRLSEGVQLALSFFVGAVTLFAGWQTLMSDQIFRRLGVGGEWAALALAASLFYFSPWLLLTLGSGFILALIVFARPSLGLAMTMLAAPLYLHPLSLLGKSFSLAELVLLPTLAGWGLRLLAAWGRREVDAPQATAEFTPTARAILRPLGALLLVGIAASLTAQHRRVALRELRLVVVEPFLFYLALVSLPMRRKERWRVLDAWVAGALGVALYGLVQYFLLGDAITTEGGIRRLHSLYGSPNNVGLYLGRVLPVLVAVVLWMGPERADGARLKRRLASWVTRLVHAPRRLAYLAAMVPIGLALLLSFSRGALVLGIPAALVFLGLMAGPSWRRLTVVLLVLGVLLLILVLRLPGVAARFEGLLDLGRGTAGFRLALWHSSLGMIRDHPFLGVGLDNFLYAYRTRYVLPTAWEEFNLSHPHNVILDFTTRLGLIGLAAFVGSQVVFWRTVLVLRRRSQGGACVLMLAFAASMVDFWAHGLVDASYFVIDLAFVYMLSMAVMVWLDAGWESVKSTRGDDHQ